MIICCAYGELERIMKYAHQKRMEISSDVLSLRECGWLCIKQGCWQCSGWTAELSTRRSHLEMSSTLSSWTPVFMMTLMSSKGMKSRAAIATFGGMSCCCNTSIIVVVILNSISLQDMASPTSNWMETRLTICVDGSRWRGIISGKMEDSGIIYGYIA